MQTTGRLQSSATEYKQRDKYSLVKGPLCTKEYKQKAQRLGVGLDPRSPTERTIDAAAMVLVREEQRSETVAWVLKVLRLVHLHICTFVHLYT